MRIIICVIFISFYNPSSAQNDFRIINGEIKSVESGIIYFSSVLSDSRFYNNNITFDSAYIHDGKFKISLKFHDDEIYPYRLYIKSESKVYVTGFVFIDSEKMQKIIIDSLNGYISPNIINSKTQQEIRDLYSPQFSMLINASENLNHFEDSIYKHYGNTIPTHSSELLEQRRDKIIHSGDSLLLAYVISHPKSIVALWKLFERYDNFHDKIIYRDISQILLKNLSHNKSLIYLDSLMHSSASLAINKFFPTFALTNTQGELHQYNFKALKSEYTLIDFWFSECTPCIKQFMEYKSTYSQFKPYSFEIIGISIDDKTKIGSWNNSIIKHVLPWPNYLDIGGAISKQYYINSFPMNFLLDKTGKIIKINISTLELKTFLKDEFAKNIYLPKEFIEPE